MTTAATGIESIQPRLTNRTFGQGQVARRERLASLPANIRIQVRFTANSITNASGKTSQPRDAHSRVTFRMVAVARSLLDNRRKRFLKDLYTTVEANDVQSPAIDRAIDSIYNCMDNLLLGGQFPECDRILREVAVERIPIVLRLPFLTVTKSAKGDLHNRREFWQTSHKLAIDEVGREKADRLFNRVK